MISNSPWGGCTNLIWVSCVEVVDFVVIPIAVERNSSMHLVWHTVASYALTYITISSNLILGRSPNFVHISGVKMVTDTTLPITVERNGSVDFSAVNIALNSLRDVSMISFLAFCYGSYFIGICCVEVVEVSSWFVVPIEWSF